jgi:phosphoribosylformylglycinamidine synthase
MLNKIGNDVPTIQNSEFFKKAFNVLQDLIKDRKIKAGHDIGSGGLITTLLEMCFADDNLGALIDLTSLGEKDTVKALFNENIGVVFQAILKWKKLLPNMVLRFSKLVQLSMVMHLRLSMVKIV